MESKYSNLMLLLKNTEKDSQERLRRKEIFNKLINEIDNEILKLNKQK